MTCNHCGGTYYVLTSQKLYEKFNNQHVNSARWQLERYINDKHEGHVSELGSALSKVINGARLSERR